MCLLCFHSIVIYSIIFWSKSSVTNYSVNRMKFRIMVGAQRRESCRKWFKNFHVLSIVNGYLLVIIIFIIDKIEIFHTNSKVSAVNGRHKHCLQRPIADLTVYQNTVNYAGIQLDRNIPFMITCLSTSCKQFELALKEFLDSSFLHYREIYITNKWLTGTMCIYILYTFLALYICLTLIICLIICLVIIGCI